MLLKQIQCPACKSASPQWLRYAYSSWLFPVACLQCGGKFYLGYSPITYILLWFLISPIYLACLLFLAVAMVPGAVVLPAFLALGAASMVLLVFLGRPTAKRDASREASREAKTGR